MIAESREAAHAGRSTLPGIVSQHAEEAQTLFAIRTALVSGVPRDWPPIGTNDKRLDEHLDGLLTGGERAASIIDAGLEAGSAGAFFLATILAIERPSYRQIEALIEIADDSCLDAIVAGLEWVEPKRLRGVIVRLLGDPDPARREVGIAACAAHRLDGGAAAGWLADNHPAVRARGLKAAGELGRRDLLPACVAAIEHDDAKCRMWGAVSAVLLGDRGRALVFLRAHSSGSEPWHESAFHLLLQAMSLDGSHSVLTDFARDSRRSRLLVVGSGVAGNPAYVPWLMKRMADVQTARAAGEAFSLITGVNLRSVGFERDEPEEAEGVGAADPETLIGPTDPDAGLPWPDLTKIEVWWQANANRFATGSRYFMGAPPTRQHCVASLKSGCQRWRMHAARYLCLLKPGTPLFNTSAPAWRQQKLLAQMA